MNNELQRIRKEVAIEKMRLLAEEYEAAVNADPQLKGYRDWIEKEQFGFGERCFLHMWRGIVDSMPDPFVFMEVGVYKGQILGLVGLLAQRMGKTCVRIGVTPLDTTGGLPDSDYREDIARVHDAFDIPRDYLLVQGDSTHPDTLRRVSMIPWRPNVLYIDGGHEPEIVESDLANYPPLLLPGGTLVIDDCNNGIPMPFGYFAGIESVSRVVDALLPPFTDHPEYELVLNLVHNRVLRKRVLP